MLYRHKHLKISCLIDDVEDIGDGKFLLIFEEKKNLYYSEIIPHFLISKIKSGEVIIFHL